MPLNTMPPERPDPVMLVRNIARSLLAVMAEAPVEYWMVLADPAGVCQEPRSMHPLEFSGSCGQGGQGLNQMNEKRQT